MGTWGAEEMAGSCISPLLDLSSSCTPLKVWDAHINFVHATDVFGCPSTLCALQVEAQGQSDATTLGGRQERMVVRAPRPSLETATGDDDDEKADNDKADGRTVGQGSGDERAGW